MIDEEDRTVTGMTDAELEEFATDIGADFDGVDLDTTEITYEVWVLGYDADQNATDFEVLVDDGYSDLSEAQKCFDYFNDIKNVSEYFAGKGVVVTKPTTHIHLLLEMCRPTEDGGTECFEVLAEETLF